MDTLANTSLNNVGGELSGFYALMPGQLQHVSYIIPFLGQMKGKAVP